MEHRYDIDRSIRDSFLSWLDELLLLLAFVAAWLVIRDPSETELWPAFPRLVFHIVICLTVVAGLLSLRWRPPIGFVITFAGYCLLGAAGVFKANSLRLSIAACSLIGSIFVTELIARLRLVQSKNQI